MKKKIKFFLFYFYLCELKKEKRNFHKTFLYLYFQLIISFYAHILHIFDIYDNDSHPNYFVDNCYISIFDSNINVYQCIFLDIINTICNI